MPLHPASEYLDLTKTQASGLFDGSGDVWEALPRIAPWLATHLTPCNDGEIRGRTPAQITLEANALRVMVGTDFPDV